MRGLCFAERYKGRRRGYIYLQRRVGTGEIDEEDERRIKKKGREKERKGKGREGY